VEERREEEKRREGKKKRTQIDRRIMYEGRPVRVS
jgi:hypothetical protein